jgi:hypothetical protein
MMREKRLAEVEAKLLVVNVESASHAKVVEQKAR